MHPTARKLAKLFREQLLETVEKKGEVNIQLYSVWRMLGEDMLAETHEIEGCMNLAKIAIKLSPAESHQSSSTHESALLRL